MEVRKCVALGRVYTFVFTENIKLWFSSKLMMIRIDWRIPPENRVYIHEKRNQEKLQDR